MPTALITGASSGIGYELTRLFARDAYDLVIVARDEKKLKKMKLDLEKECSVQVFVFAQDLSQPSAAKKVFEKVQSMKLHIDVLVNNAGFGEYGMFTKTDLEKEERMIQVNITALTQLTKYFLPLMVEKKSGKVLNVASTAAFIPGPFMAVYYATKAYVLSFTEALSKELEGSGVTLTALCPGPTQSNFSKNSSSDTSPVFKGKTLPTAKEVAVFGYQSLLNSKVVAIHGISNNILIPLLRFVPRSIVRDVVSTAQKPVK